MTTPTTSSPTTPPAAPAPGAAPAAPGQAMAPDAASAPQRTRSEAELKALVEEANELFGQRNADTQELLAWAGRTFGKSLAVACSMASDTVVPALVSQHIKDVDVLFLDTGYHFQETLETRDAFASDWPVNVRTLLPRLTVPEQDLTPELSRVVQIVLDQQM